MAFLRFCSFRRASGLEGIVPPRPRFIPGAWRRSRPASHWRRPPSWSSRSQLPCSSPARCRSSGLCPMRPVGSDRLGPNWPLRRGNKLTAPLRLLPYSRGGVSPIASDRSLWPTASPADRAWIVDARWPPLPPTKPHAEQRAGERRLASNEGRISPCLSLSNGRLGCPDETRPLLQPALFLAVRPRRACL